MTTGELLTLLVRHARQYREVSAAGLLLNEHMHELEKDVVPTQEEIDAVLVGFINHIGTQAGVDMALYTCDLKRSAHA